MDKSEEYVYSLDSAVTEYLKSKLTQDDCENSK
jgi:hypothetical protein